MVIYFIIAALIVLGDQISKILIAKSFEVGTQKVLIEGILSFIYVKNEGAAFGIFQGARVFFIIITVLVFVLGYFYIKRNPLTNILEKCAVAFIAGGAVGNFIDRVYFGFVRDFISADFIDFPVFNVADCFVTVGACLLVLAVMLGEKNKENS